MSKVCCEQCVYANLVPCPSLAGGKAQCPCVLICVNSTQAAGVFACGMRVPPGIPPNRSLPRAQGSL